MELTHNDAYVIESIEGLDPPDAVINTTRNANSDGSVFNSSYVDNRQITITMAINGPAEVNRINLYKYFKNKYPVRLFYKNTSRDVFIDGYCKSIQIEFFNKKQIAQLTIFCPDPYFKDIEQAEASFLGITPMFEFPFSISQPIPFSETLIEDETEILNKGDVETGAVFILRARGYVANPTIYNLDTNESFKLNITMQNTDEIIINTKKKQKSVEKTHNGVTTNIIGSVGYGSVWLQIPPGVSKFAVNCTVGPENLDTYIYLDDLYEGV